MGRILVFTSFVMMCLGSVAGARPPKLAGMALTPLSAPVMGFDFGPAGAPCWPGFEKFTPENTFKLGAKFGWDKPAEWFQTVDNEKYDPLTRDYCRPRNGDAQQSSPPPTIDPRCTLLAT